MGGKGPAYLALPGSRRLDLGQGPLVMGIINCNGDSFFADSRVSGIEQGLARAEEMLAEGADILDLGAESTRPGAEYLDGDTELGRVLPLVRALRSRSSVPISVDTRKAMVARACLDAGADIINDVSALEDDPGLAGLIAQRGAAAVLMHKRGRPVDMQLKPRYEDAPGEVRNYLRVRLDYAQAAGISPDRIVVDPGIGFGKRLEDNLEIIRRLDESCPSGYPILVGLSRKSFIGTLTGRDAEARLAGTLAANAIAAFLGADILRVHDVAEAKDAAAIARALRARPDGER